MKRKLLSSTKAKSTSLAVLLVSVFLLSVLGGVQFVGKVSAVTAYTEYNGILGGANYTIRIPSPIESWNRDLVLFCRGYDHAMPSNPMGGTLGSYENWAQAALSRGAAFAVTTYGSGGYCVQKGMDTTHQLAQYVKSTFNATGKIYLAGISMGGNIVLMLGQKYPNVYSGVLDICGAKNLTDLYDGGVFMSTANDSQMDARIQSFTAPVPPYPFSLFGSSWRTIFRNWCTQVAADMVVEFGGTPSAVPQAYRDFDPLYHANISIPVITVQGTSDALVPYARTLEYQAAVNAAGKSNLYRMYSILGGQHGDAPVMNDALNRLGELMAWSNALTGSDWPMHRHDLQHTGYSASPAPNTNQTLWTYTAGNSVGAGPTVADGRVYVGSWDTNVHCLDAATGALVWNYTTGSRVLSYPAVADGRVYVGSNDKNLYCLDAVTGAKIWNYTTGNNVQSSPAIADGRVYVGSWDDKVYCLNAATGALVWNYTTGGDVISSPAVADGKVFVGSNDDDVYCLNAADGAHVWSYNTSGHAESCPAVVDGRVYVNTNYLPSSGNIYCLNASTGANIWNYSTSGWVISSASIADGKVYVGSYDNNVYCLNALTGALVWNYTTSGDVYSSPAVADGKVYVGTLDNKVYCLNAANGAYIWSYTTGGSVYSSPAVANGVVYVGSFDKKVYAFSSSPPIPEGLAIGVIMLLIGTIYFRKPPRITK
jgi:outer membrane protein assembly factor BamB/pimeloyl-ACP methyl ester carboxylesterase